MADRHKHASAGYKGYVDNPISTGLRCKCPRCGEGQLFRGMLKLREACPVCGLSYASADSGDGPAVFVIMIIGFVVVGLVLLVELAYQPPIWVHMALWLPLTVGLALGLLRPLKGLLIVLQYKHNAAEGKIDED
ncbi:MULTISPECIES: DUF983 domain-containing protein [Pseudovibrio]|uniref:DUF983 domain-containing protein n=1 Tax=Stappiaceae TaxID=2821832 RepID=UPI002366D9E5|nr:MULTISPECIES: DUF983 domain-containing protein [Pseudovibrio]MDD7911296.1 DUF983 domain-containing protein [Pseudovibrio exalbescens]MDX5593017.1 DUF983 domain-containing protein [Pseudovibrio sp. SPO723]